ncbi:MAG: polyprenyl synthetase family protein [Anaerolineales bacterium]|nr:polyprenyl synthetase family protein [Anaerolineales bacterium]
MKSGDFMSLVQEEMQRVEILMRSQAEDRHPDLEIVLNHLLSSGGKRIRPVVALLSGEMLNAEPESLVTLAASIEMLHTATLVHDDLIDGAILRRGIATLNSQWSPAATVLTGDFIFARAAKLAAETNSVAVIRLFAETLTTIVNGELTQLFSSRRVANREDYDRRIHAKTASLFELATASGALLSPASEDMVEKLRCFGNAIGMAFQIVDDILDFTGEQSSVGKPVASDLRQGLITLPALFYHEAHPDDPDMARLLSENYLSEELIIRLVEAIRQSGAIQQSLEVAQGYITQSRKWLEFMPDNPQRRALDELARYIVARDL